MRRSQREIRDLLTGWTLVRNRKHQIYRCPCGDHIVVVPNSTSDHRMVKNLRSQIRRCAA